MLDATRAVISEVGPAALTIDEVARRSGVAKTTIYRHFPNSAALVLGALSDIPASVVSPDTGTLRGDLLEIIDQFLHFAADSTIRSMMIHALASIRADPDLERLHRELRQGRQRPIHLALMRAQQRGELPNDLDLDLVASLVEGPFIARRLIADQSVSRKEASTMVDLLLNGLNGLEPHHRSASPTSDLTSSHVDTPIGRLILIASPVGLRAVMHHDVDDEARRVRLSEQEILPGSTPILDEAQKQLDEYFSGHRHTFDLPLDPEGTGFQRAVWASLTSIPTGETRTYTEQAVSLGRPRAVRAVAGADGRNPLAVIVPCHRIIGADGSLTGYAWGVDRKRWLLNHEGVAV